MSIYDDMQKVASDILTEFDQGGIQYIGTMPDPKSLRVFTFNPASDVYEAFDGIMPIDPPDNPSLPIEVVTTVPGVARGVSFKYIQDGLAASSDLQCVIPVGVVVPKLAGFMALDNVRYKIIQVMTIPPVGVPVAHRVIFRK